MGIEACPWCFGDVRVTWRDTLAGMAVRCRTCGAWSGPFWTPMRFVAAAFSSIVVNGLALFLVTGPLRALGWIGIHVAVVAAAFSAGVAADSEPVIIAAGALAMLGPMCIAGYEYYRHVDPQRRGVHGARP